MALLPLDPGLEAGVQLRRQRRYPALVQLLGGLATDLDEFGAQRPVLASDPVVSGAALGGGVGSARLDDQGRWRVTALRPLTVGRRLRHRALAKLIGAHEA